MIEDYTWSDHQSISLGLRRTPQIKRHPSKQLGWNTAKLDKEYLDSVITEGKEALFAQHDSAEQASGVETLVDATMQLIHKACDASLPRNRTRKNRRTNYWWTEEIAVLHNRCLQSRQETNGGKNVSETFFFIITKF